MSITHYLLTYLLTLAQQMTTSAVCLQELIVMKLCKMVDLEKSWLLEFNGAFNTILGHIMSRFLKEANLRQNFHQKIVKG